MRLVQCDLATHSLRRTAKANVAQYGVAQERQMFAAVDARGMRDVAAEEEDYDPLRIVL